MQLFGRQGLRGRSPAHACAVPLLLALCLLQAAEAQTSEGSLEGQARPGLTVRIESLDTGAAMQRKADESGRFSVSRLQPGRYRVSSDDGFEDVVVSLGALTSVQIRAGQRIEIQASGAVRRPDMSSSESSTVYTQDDIRKLPVTRNFNAAGLLVPGAVKGAFSGLVSFGGASVAENAYFINGFDVTNLRSLLSYAELPFDAMAEVQYKTGGFGAEYGRALGGIQSVVTQRGGSAWKTSVSLDWEPSRLKGRNVDVASREPEEVGIYRQFASANRSENRKLVLTAGGPLVAGELFGFGLLELRDDRHRDFGQLVSTVTVDRTPRGMLKLDWTPSDSHALEFTGIWNRLKTRRTDYTSQANYSVTHDGPGRDTVFRSGGDVVIAKYTGYVNDRFTVSALAGQVRSLREKLRPLVVSCGTQQSKSRSSWSPVGMWAGCV